MKISDALLPEFDHEMANTRKVLERIPEDKFGWKPHAKSFVMGKLAAHVATLPSWVNLALTRDSFDLAEPFTMPEPSTQKELLAVFDTCVANARAAIANEAEEIFFKPWSLTRGETVFFTIPKIAVLRGFVMNHSIHHRAQLSVYLRLNDLPVPGLYGPSADEGSM
jgi:uncharacterized damage-inducible protein DinB